MIHPLPLMLAAMVTLTGCQDLQGLVNSLRPQRTDPEVRWVSEPTEILDLRGPARAHPGEPVELQVQAVIGSSSCNKAGTLQLEVDDAARTVTVRATRLAAQADPMIPCTDDYGWTRLTATFTPQATGTYRIKAEKFRPGFAGPDTPVPRGQVDLTVTASGSLP